MKILLNGAQGKMGQAVLKALPQGDIVVIERNGPTTFSIFQGAIDVGIDFSTPDGTMELLELALRYCFPLVIGTTGLNAEQQSQMHKAAKRIKILYSRNFSLGIHVFRKLIRMAVQHLPLDFQIEVVERHHKHKTDAPSGTAKACLEDIQAVRADSDVVYGRHSQATGDRNDNEIGVHSLRGGEVFGEHCIFLTGDHEELILEHRAFDRLAFAQGALAAARWLVTNPATHGLFSFQDVVA
ncbi:MAG: 4-hydroxy-tetrahydrodipicolinate reductase [Verrucomicrobiota bacterium]|nr:MAG: 4-hydroxy-tetrahydrodipicolinate reductase [Verrucomicrobiota bacterium]